MYVCVICVVIRHSSNIAQLFKSLFNIIRARNIEPLLSNSNNINYSIIEVFFHRHTHTHTHHTRICKKKQIYFAIQYALVVYIVAVGQFIRSRNKFEWKNSICAFDHILVSFS